MAKFQKGEWVAWNWGSSDAKGKVQDHATDRIERTIDGNKIHRNGSEDNPAYVLEQENGQTVLKLESELKKADSPNS